MQNKGFYFYKFAFKQNQKLSNKYNSCKIINNSFLKMLFNPNWLCKWVT